MANAYINLYKGSPTAGGTDGTLVSLDGVGTSPISFTLDATIDESAKQAVALRCESGYTTSGDTTVEASGTNASKWSFCATENGTYTSTLTISSAIGTTNTVFYVKASSVNTESPGTDTSVTVDVTAVIVPA